MNLALRTLVRTASMVVLVSATATFAQTSSVKLIETVNLPGYSGGPPGRAPLHYVAKGWRGQSGVANWGDGSKDKPCICSGVQKSK